MWRKYWNILKSSYQSSITYRGAVFIRSLRDVVAVLFFVVLWSALFKNQAEIGGFTFSSMVTYYILVRIIDQVYCYETSKILTTDVTLGDLSNYLVKPLRYFAWLAFFALGKRAARVSISIPLVVFTFIAFPQFTIVPPSIFYWSAFLASIALSWILLFEMAFLVGALSFWVSETSGFRTAVDQMIGLLGGFWVPLNLFPEKIGNVLLVLPFKYISYYPTLVYRGLVSPGEVWTGMSVQALWVLLFGFSCVVVWRWGVYNYASFGK